MTTPTPGQTYRDSAEYERIRARAEHAAAATTLGVLNIASAGLRLALLRHLAATGTTLTAREVRRTQVATGLSLAFGLAATATAFKDPHGTRGNAPVVLSRAASVASWLVPLAINEQRNLRRAAKAAARRTGKAA